LAGRVAIYPALAPATERATAEAEPAWVIAVVEVSAVHR
jgi:hypothetical protein